MRNTLNLISGTVGTVETLFQLQMANDGGAEQSTIRTEIKHSAASRSEVANNKGRRGSQWETSANSLLKLNIADKP